MWIIAFTLYLVSISPIFGVKYKITRANNDIVQMDHHVITSEAGNKKINVQDDFHVFDEDLLALNHKTPIFIMTKNFICHKLETGAFADKEITETIVISNTKIQKIPNGAFKNLKIFELILKDNEIATIEEEAIVDLPKLEILNLANNKLKEFFSNSVINSPARFFDLAFNELEEIGENWFSFMNPEIPVSILLDNNLITLVNGAAFSGALLSTLNLKSNKLEELQGEIFEGDTVSTLYLQDNSLGELPDSFFELTKLKLGFLVGNPLSCDTIKRLKKMAKETHATISFPENC